MQVAPRWRAHAVHFEAEVSISRHSEWIVKVGVRKLHGNVRATGEHILLLRIQGPAMHRLVFKRIRIQV
jgi:hypothetical protein